MSRIRRHLARLVRIGRSGSKQKFAYKLDGYSPSGVRGWVVHRTGIQEVRALLDGSPAGQVTLGIQRPDVAAFVGNEFDAIDSGFAIDLPERSIVEGGVQTLVIEFVARRFVAASSGATALACCKPICSRAGRQDPRLTISERCGRVFAGSPAG